ncbi:MAG: PilZ domain-containing protein [Spirochaetes bacterium]|nr:MAG: PilZ domain-containing protein [Spirochaetota bacterium]
MTAEAKLITDKSLFGGIFARVFMRGNVFIKTSGLNIQVESFHYSEGELLVKLSEPGGELNNPLFYVRHGEEVFFTHAKLLSRDEDGQYRFHPVDVQILQAPRREDRRQVAGAQNPGREPAYISNIVSDFILRESLSNNRKKIEIFKDSILKKIGSGFPASRVYLVNEKPGDGRMEYFRKERVPLFINNLDDREGLAAEPPGTFYLTRILPNEPEEKSVKLVSEIAVPFLYRLMLPFGYLQVNGADRFGDEDFAAMKKLGMSISTVMTNDRQLIKGSEEKIAVTDLSASGMGIFFRDRPLIKYFKDGSQMVFAMFLPGGRQSNMLCEVRNISIMKNTIYRVGCEIVNMDSIGEVHYTEYLESLAAPAGAPGQ